MTDDRSLERAARSWLEAGPTRAPDRSVDAALARIQTTRQERGSLVTRGMPRLNPVLRVGSTAIVAALVFGVVIFAFRLPSSGGPMATPSPSPAATSAPSTQPTRPPRRETPGPVFPASPLPDPPGDPLTADLLGRTYVANPPEVQATQQLVLTLRSADDPHCLAMFEGRSTCFTYLWTPNYPLHVSDPGARGSARIVGGRLVLSFDIVPFDEPCVGQAATYDIADEGSTLSGVTTPACTVPGFTAVTIQPS